MSFNPNMANREVIDMVLLNFQDKTPFMSLDFANVTTTGLESERVFATGGHGAPNRVSFDSNRTGTLTVETQITPMKLYAMLSGSEITSVAKYAKRVKATSVSKEIELDEKPVSGSVYVYAADDDCGTAVDVTVADKKVTLTTASDGEFIVYYLVEKTGSGVQTVKFNAKTFPKAFTIYGDTPWKTEDEEIVAMHLTYYKAQPQSNMELSFSNNGDPTTVSITFDLLADDNDNIYDMSIIED